MAAKRYLSGAHRGYLTATLGLILTTGCETARNPVALPGPSPERTPPSFTVVTSVPGPAAQRAGADGLTGELEEAHRRILSAPGLRTERVPRESRLQENMAKAASPSAAQPALEPTSSEAANEDIALIEFGTEIRMPFGGPHTVTAYTIASRATHISHVMQITKTVGGRSYTRTFNDDSGFLNQPSLYTTVGISGGCETFTTINAQTDHSAGSLTYGREQGMSTADGSCGIPPEPCEGGGDGGGPDDVVVQGAGGEADASPAGDCTGGGPAPGGETTRCYTVTTDYYWYYPDTGTYEYRYSEETTWCEEDTA